MYYMQQETMKLQDGTKAAIWVIRAEGTNTLIYYHAAFPMVEARFLSMLNNGQVA